MNLLLSVRRKSCEIFLNAITFPGIHRTKIKQAPLKALLKGLSSSVSYIKLQRLKTEISNILSQTYLFSIQGVQYFVQYQ